jgi:hypothetical protein
MPFSVGFFRRSNRSTNANWLWVFPPFSITLYSLASQTEPSRLIGLGTILASFGSFALLGDDYETAKPPESNVNASYLTENTGTKAAG